MRSFDILELREQISNIETKKQAAEFLEDLAVNIGKIPKVQYEAAADYICAVGAVLHEVPDASERFRDQDAKHICALLFHALLYE